MFYLTKKLLKSKKGLTLMETLVVISLIAIITLALIFLLRPKTQIEKAWDAKRKKDIDTLSKIFEEYYNDKGCYPKPTDVCSTEPTTFSKYNILGCKICNKNFSPYKEELPCDPQSPNYDYLYTVDNEDCPTKFVIYAHASIKDDLQSQEISCTNNTCGPEGEYGYAKSSPNGEIITRKCKEFTTLFCYKNGICNQCKANEQSNLGSCNNSETCDINQGIFVERDDFSTKCSSPCYYEE